MSGNSNDEEGEINEFSDANEDLHTVECPTLEEVRDAFRALENHKAPGADNIPAELLKDGGNKVIHAIHNLMALIWEQEQVPDEWRKSIICTIHKKGDELSCENYRGITLLYAAYKVPTNIKRLKLEPYTENIIGEYQAAFRTGRSTIDQMFTVKHIREKCWENSIKVYQIYVDFK